MSEKRTAYLTVRLTESERKRLDEAAQSAGYATVANYVRASLLRDTAQTQMEQRIASMLATNAKEIHRFSKQGTVLFAMFDQLVKMIFTYWPAPAHEALPAAIAAAKAQHQRYLRSVSAALQNGSQAAAQTLADTV